MSSVCISVIVPIYNYSVYLPTCLNSILNQTFNNIEVILVNNSKNNIKKLTELYDNKFNNVKVIQDYSKDNKLDLNFAINQAEGKYITFIDSNDYIEQDMLKKLFVSIEENNLDISICKSYFINDLNSSLGNKCPEGLICSINNFKDGVFKGSDFLNFIIELYSKPYNKIFRRSFLLENNIDFPDSFLGNEFFLYGAFLKAKSISIVDEYLYARRFNNSFIKNYSVDCYFDALNKFNLISDKFVDPDFLQNNDLYFQNFLNYNGHDIFFEDYKKIFSVIIFCSDIEEHISEAIDSVINQTLDFENFIEIILVNGDCTNNISDICKKFVNKYPNNIKLLYEENINNSSLDLILKYSSGKYVNLLEVQNCLKEDTLSNAYNFFESHYKEFAHCNFPICFWNDDYLKVNTAYKKIISVIIPCFNVEEYISEAIDSVINQTLDFENFIEIILVDDGSTDRTFDICQEYSNNYPDNIILLSQENNGQASARNLGLKYISGKYVNFLDADDKLMANTFENAIDFFENHYAEIDLVSFPMYFFGRKYGSHILNYKFKKNLIVSLNDCWNYPQLSASSAIFKSNLFNRFKFDTKLITSEDSVMINKLLLEKMAYGVISTGGYCYRKRFDESSTIDKSIYDKEYYTNRLKGYFSELIKYSKFKLGYVPKFIQYLIIYDIKWMFLNGDLFSIFNHDELLEIKRNLRYVFANIDDEVILDHFKNKYTNIKLLIFYLKYDKLIIKNNGGIISLNAGDNELDIFNKHDIYIDIIEIKNNYIFISGLLNYNFYDKNDFGIVLIVNSKKTYYPKYVNYSNRKEHNEFESKICFDFEVPINFDDKIELKIIFSGLDEENMLVNAPIKFFNHARMSEICNYSIWGDYFIEFKNNYFIVSKYSYIKLLKKELSILSKILKIKGSYWTSALFFHFIYLILFVFLRNKNIWLIMDRPDRADDNAEHFFNYLVGIEDIDDKYFVISEDSKDYSRLSSIWNNILSFYSIKHRILYLFANKVISSQVDESIINPFWGKNSKWYSGLITSDKIFLQHGVAKDDMSTWLRKYDKNVKLLVTTADIEAKSFEEYNYNYPEGVVQVLGLPRYDHLSNDSDNKQILIMPSWRRSLIHADNSQILKSEYFLRFNSLINNKKLINLAKSLKYKIIFKPHPNTFDYIELFDKNDYVIIDDKSKYQELFNNSSLLITDYSSLAFDFAYIKKPIIYYQYGTDYHFDNNFFVYETMGFGEVISDEDKLIDTVEEYLKNNCKIKNKYLSRSNNFYKYNDKNNCKRVYEAIKKIK